MLMPLDMYVVLCMYMYIYIHVLISVAVKDLQVHIQKVNKDDDSASELLGTTVLAYSMTCVYSRKLVSGRNP